MNSCVDIHQRAYPDAHPHHPPGLQSLSKAAQPHSEYPTAGPSRGLVSARIATMIVAWTFVLVGKSSRHPPLVVYLNSTYMAINYCRSLGCKTWQIAYQNAQIISYKLVASTQVAEWFSCLAVEAVEFAALKPLLLKLQSLHSLLP